MVLREGTQLTGTFRDMWSYNGVLWLNFCDLHTPVWASFASVAACNVREIYEHEDQ